MERSRGSLFRVRVCPSLVVSMVILIVVPSGKVSLEVVLLQTPQSLSCSISSSVWMIALCAHLVLHRQDAAYDHADATDRKKPGIVFEDCFHDAEVFFTCP